MQAIILAAGMGKRLGNLTAENTKCMVKVNGVPLIERMLTLLDEYSLSQIIIVTGYKGISLQNFIISLNINTPIKFIENIAYETTNNIYSLGLAQKYLLTDDTILLESDLIFDKSILKKLIKDKNKNVALVAKYESWMDGTVVRINSDHKITSFIPKSEFNYNEASTYYKTVNIYKLSKEFCKKHYIPFLNAYMQAQGKNEYYEQVLRILTFIDKTDLKALPLSKELWYEIDDIQDLDIAETLFSPPKNAYKKYTQRYGGFWRFPAILDYCYLINPYYPPKRMIEEMQSNFTKLLTEYPSGASINNLLIAKYFGLYADFVCIGNGAAELIRSLMKAIKGKLGVILPTFEEYPHRYNKDDLVIFSSKKEDFSYTADDIINFYSKNIVSTLLIINPDNPSGNYISHSDILRILEWSKSSKTQLIIDESFIDFCEIETSTLLSDEILKSHQNLIVIKSISKSYGIPGLRLGILATSNKEILTTIKKDIPIWNINSFAEFYIQIFSKYKKEYKNSILTFLKEKRKFLKNLQKISFLKVYPSQANYFLCELTARYTATELAQLLLWKYKILIKDCSTKAAFNGRQYVRIAIRDSRDNQKLIEALENL